MSRWRRVALAASITAVLGAATGVVLVRTTDEIELPRRTGGASSSPAPAAVDLTGLVPAARPIASYPSIVSAGQISATAVGRVLAGPLADPSLGASVSGSVVDLLSGQVLLSRTPGRAVVPASTAKLVTAVAALHALGADARLSTRVMSAPPVAGTVGDLVLVGGGDQTLASERAPARYARGPRLSALAATVAKRIRRVRGDVIVDGSLFAGPSLGPDWKPTYFTEGSIARITALEVDAGRVRPGKSPRYIAPDLQAGLELRAALKKRGVIVAGRVVRGRAPAGAMTLATVRSPAVPALVERMLRGSDNDLAESLGRAVALDQHEPATFAGEVRALRRVLSAAGLAGVADGLRDASGLSRADRVTTGGLVSLLRFAARDPLARRLLVGLPVSGFDGTLEDRYRTAPGTGAGAGLVRAKTGTLDNVTTLAGFVVTRGGRVLAFAFAADRLPTRSAARAATQLDRAVSALAACTCAA
jgi:D-alanyl-D-alanine carboxypeptidase/D-alanyl-D-alanine-endopeptidase (penicillin-binding protein 4)